MDLIPSLPSEIIGYCLTWMVMAPKVSCTMVRGTCLTRLAGVIFSTDSKSVFYQLFL